MKNTLPFLAGLLIILGGIVVGVGAVNYQTSRKAKAMESFQPNGVRISNVADSSFTVSWTTNASTTGYISYGEAADNLPMKAVDDRDKDQTNPGAFFIHYITLQGLKPGTIYYFRVGSNNESFDLAGTPYKTTTGSVLSDQPVADAAYGQVVTQNNDPADGAIVYLQIPSAGLLSALTKPSGAWAIPISSARSESLDKYVSFNKQKQSAAIWVESGNLGSTSATVNGNLINPVPTLALGKIYDFSAAKTTTPPVSKFDQPESVAPTDVSLLSPNGEENLNTNQPVIIGKAPPGTKINIEVNSQTAITGEVVADPTGNFSFQVPQNLPAGNHTVTISAMINGVLKTIKKSFVVEAAGTSSIPYYSATPSATLVPSAIPTATLKPTLTPKPTTLALAPTMTPSPKPPTPTPTPTVKIISSTKPAATLAPSSIPTATLKPTATPKPQVTVAPTPIQQLPKSGTPEFTTLIALLGGSFLLLGLTLGNDRKRA